MPAGWHVCRLRTLSSVNKLTTWGQLLLTSSPTRQSRCSINGQPFPTMNFRKYLCSSLMCLHWAPTMDHPTSLLATHPASAEVKTETPFHRTIGEYTSYSDNKKLSAVAAGSVWQRESYRNPERLLNIENKNQVECTKDASSVDPFLQWIFTTKLFAP